MPVGQGALIRFAAVCRRMDRIPLASLAVADPRDYSEDLLHNKMERVLRSSGIDQHSRLTINDHDVGFIHYDSDSICLYLVMTSPDYPQRTAFSFLSELRTQFQDRFEADVSTAKPMGFSRAARGLLKDLCAQYNVLERVDKVAQVNFQVEEVKQTMQQNIQTVIQNQENLETLVDKSDMMRNEAYVFQKSAGEAKNKMWWQNTKMLIALILVVILLVVVIPLAVHFSRKSTP